MDENMSSTESEDGEGLESLFSDDSSFYGDDEMKAEYEQRAAVFDPTEFWQSHGRDLQRISEHARKKSQTANARNEFHRERLSEIKQEKTTSLIAVIGAKACTPIESNPEPVVKEPFNPYEGDDMAKQLSETIDNFFSRLPPSTTTVESGPWIWIANPMSSRRHLQSDLGGFKTTGHELLEEYLLRKARVEEENPEKSAGFITNKLRPDREWLEKSIVDQAKAKGVTSGKWMLFPYTNVVDETWRKVVKATMAGSLGCAAKVATDDGSGAMRLICVYTQDFSDTLDVKRVLAKMNELQLIKADQGIYYKCDAYTHLTIMAGNEYKLKASMYSSKDMLKGMVSQKTTKE